MPWAPQFSHTQYPAERALTHMSVQEIEAAIRQLPSPAVAELAEWLEEYRSDMWDRQIEEDAKAGRLNDLIRRAEEDIAAGRVSPLP